MADLSPLVDVDWLTANSDAVVLIDCTWTITNEDAATLPKGFVPGAVEFDLSAVKALPLKQQTEGVVAAQLSALGVTADDTIIVYDRHGLFSAPRLWWLLKTLGHDAVAILNGGLPAWINAGHTVDASPATRTPALYIERPALLCGSDFDDILKTGHADRQIVDARGSGRFNGTEPEPRKGLRSGRIPGSLNLPFGPLRHNGRLKSKSDLTAAISAAGIDMNRPIITSCGSGVTAAALAFIFFTLGKSDISVYTGSWAEYGASDAPIGI